MGIGSILKAKKCILVAWGAKKSPIVFKALTSEVSSEVPATYLQNHANSVFVVDKELADAFP
jgi:glucosamine-6-phosphate deaminase